MLKLSKLQSEEVDEMKLGVVGLPNVGKSTLFNAITHAGAQAANFPFCTIEPNVGVVAVPDERLDKLAALYNSKKVTPATIEFVDIAGLVKGASKGEGLGNKFLSHIREVDAIVHVVRCFEDENVTHVENTVDPVRDIGIINLELILADLETVQKRYDKAFGMIKSGDKKYKIESDLLRRILDRLEQELPVRGMEFTDDERKYVNDLFLLRQNPCFTPRTFPKRIWAKTAKISLWRKKLSTTRTKPAAKLWLSARERKKRFRNFRPTKPRYFSKI